jgi:6-phosphogluconolactonase
MFTHEMIEHQIDYGPRGEVHIVRDPETLARRAAALTLEISEDAARERGAAYVALSGGSTPKRMGELLAEPDAHRHPVWSAMHIFWGDERWAPLESDESNAGIAMRTFLERVDVPPDQVYPMPTHLDDPHDAAQVYEGLVNDVVPVEEGVPEFDLVFLGMGDDGHTASLFPHTPAIHEEERLVVANFVPKLDTMRLTMTPPAINAGRNVIFLVAGAGKAEKLAAVLEGPDRPAELPSQIIRPASGKLIWLVDQAAASALETLRNSSR